MVLPLEYWLASKIYGLIPSPAWGVYPIVRRETPVYVLHKGELDLWPPHNRNGGGRGTVSHIRV